MALEVGFQPIPGYQLTQPVGAGAFGHVWEAMNNGKIVALKFIDCRAHSPSTIAGEVRVLRALAELRHPNIIQLLSVNASSKYLILVMERADSNLADLRAAYQERNRGNIPPDHALDLLEQAATALDFLAGIRLPGVAGSRGFQHCDVKPSNLLLMGEQLKVADFGLCAGAGSYTHKSGWKGTIPYAAPELFNGAAAPGTDQYALAVTFCEMVMGDRPFIKEAAGSPDRCPIDLTKLREREFPVISRALHPFPSSRWPTCKAFIQALRKIIEAAPTSSARITSRDSRASLRRRQA